MLVEEGGPENSALEDISTTPPCWKEKRGKPCMGKKENRLLLRNPPRRHATAQPPTRSALAAGVGTGHRLWVKEAPQALLASAARD